jgi:hypothetical protein
MCQESVALIWLRNVGDEIGVFEDLCWYTSSGRPQSAHWPLIELWINSEPGAVVWSSFDCVELPYNPHCETPYLHWLITQSPKDCECDPLSTSDSCRMHRMDRWSIWPQSNYYG